MTRGRYFFLCILMLALSVTGCASDSSPVLEPDTSVLAESPVASLKEGYVDVEFVVNEHGRTENPVVIASTDPRFEKAAIGAVLKFRYKPGVVDGESVSVAGVKTRITFKLEDEVETGEEE